MTVRGGGGMCDCTWRGVGGGEVEVPTWWYVVLPVQGWNHVGRGKGGGGGLKCACSVAVSSSLQNVVITWQM